MQLLFNDFHVIPKESGLFSIFLSRNIIRPWILMEEVLKNGHKLLHVGFGIAIGEE